MIYMDAPYKRGSLTKATSFMNEKGCTVLTVWGICHIIVQATKIEYYQILKCIQHRSSAMNYLVVGTSMPR